MISLGRASAVACCVVGLMVSTLERGATPMEERFPKSPPRPMVTVDVQSPRVQGWVERCSRLATAKGVFGDVRVTILKDDPTEPRVSGSPMLGPERAEIEQCVRESLLKLAQRFDIEPVGALPVWPGSFRFTIGQVRPLLPPLDVLMPRWVKALDVPPVQSSGARASLALQGADPARPQSPGRGGH